MPNADEDVGQLELSYMAGRNINSTALKNCLAVSAKGKYTQTHIPGDSSTQNKGLLTSIKRHV